MLKGRAKAGLYTRLRGLVCCTFSWTRLDSVVVVDFLIGLVNSDRGRTMG